MRAQSAMKKPAGANSPNSKPFTSFIAEVAPSERCTKTTRTAPNRGKGESSPLRYGPSTDATAVSNTTKTVATTILAGMSQRGGAVAELPLSSDFSGVRGTSKSTTTRARSVAKAAAIRGTLSRWRKKVEAAKPTQPEPKDASQEAPRLALQE